MTLDASDAPVRREQSATVAIVVVPQGTHSATGLAGALREHHADWDVRALWCGDPQLRPPAGPVEWCRCGAGMPPGEWEQVLVSSRQHTAEWRRVVACARDALGGGASRVVVCWAGAVAVVGDLSALVDAGDHAATVVARVLGPLPDDGLAPQDSDLLDAGRFSTTVAVFRAGAEAALDWIESRLRLDPLSELGRWLELAVDHFGFDVCRDPAVGVGLWRWSDDPVLLDVPTYDVERAWALDAAMTGAGRIEIVANARADVLARVRAQLAGRRHPLTLPGGLVVDDHVRGAIANAAAQPWDTEPPPPPWSNPGAFRDWLAPRYWPYVHRVRRDLVASFPEPTGRDREAFEAWSREAFTADSVPFLLAGARATTSPISVADELRADGVNVVGYLTRDSSLGDVARRIVGALRLADVEVSTIATHRSASPPLASAPPCDDRIAHPTTIAVVTADQFPLLAGDHPELFARELHTIGYWFWELEHVPESMRAALDLVDEIWTGSRFVRDAFAAVTDVPVRHVPIPIPEPVPSTRSRRDFELLAPYADRFVFLMSFDHLSVTERKNPVGAIEAFVAAFAPDEGPVLIVKTMNGRGRWTHHQRVLAAAAGRRDIVVWDEHLSRSDNMALVRSADCMVSLHRSEGLGLHLAEAMWLGTPTIATRYSGNVDFMDDTCALLVGYDRVNVTRGQGVYPSTATWAAPHLDEAAEAMRAISADAALHDRLATAGRARMEAQPSLRDTGELIASLSRAADRRQ